MDPWRRDDLVDLLEFDEVVDGVGDVAREPIGSNVIGNSSLSCGTEPRMLPSFLVDRMSLARWAVSRLLKVGGQVIDEPDMRN